MLMSIVLFVQENGWPNTVPSDNPKHLSILRHKGYLTTLFVLRCYDVLDYQIISIKHFDLQCTSVQSSIFSWASLVANRTGTFCMDLGLDHRWTDLEHCFMFVWLLRSIFAYKTILNFYSKYQMQAQFLTICSICKCTTFLVSLAPNTVPIE